MKRCTVEHLNFTRNAATEFRCGRRFYFTPFRIGYESKSERTIEIGPNLPKLS